MRSLGHVRRLAAIAAVAGCALPAPAMGAGSARYIMSAEYTGTYTLDQRWPDGSQSRTLRLRTTWTGTSAPFTLRDLGTAGRARLVSPPLRLTGLIEHTGTGAEDRGDWHDVTDGPKVRDCIANVRQFLAGPATATATVRILHHTDRPSAAAHSALVRLASPGVTVRTAYAGYACTVNTGPGEPTDVVSVPDMVTTCTGECLMLPLTLLRPQWPLVVPGRGARVSFRRRVTFVSTRNVLTDPGPLLYQALPAGGSQRFAFGIRLRLVPVR